MPTKKSYRMQPISLQPLTVKEAISAFMAVDPKKVERKIKREREEKS